MANSDSAILVVGHGTRKLEGAEQLRTMVQRMRDLQPRVPMYESFLELAQPSIEDAIARMGQDGVRSAIVVPVLLFSAGHAKSDIPEAVANAATPFGIRILGQTSPLGTSEPAIALSQVRFREIAKEGIVSGCPEGHCAHPSCDRSVCWLRHRSLGRVGLAMVGRGTSDESALEAMRRFTSLAVGERDVMWWDTGFFAGGMPHVDELLERASRTECATIIVQPHLLFEGELMDQLRAKILRRSQDNPNQIWLLARALGSDAALARLFLEIAHLQFLSLVPPLESAGTPL